MRSSFVTSFSSLLLAIFVPVGTQPLFAQSGTSGALAGNVADASGAAIPAATVTAVEVNNRATRTGQTDATGHYLFSQINPGTYRVSASATGNNGNVNNQQGLSARPYGSFLDQGHSNSLPLGQIIQTGQRGTFPATPLFIYQPRVSVAYALPRRAAVHAGFGVFSDLIPAQIADLASQNAPYAPTFVGGLGGQVGGIGIAPGVPGSAVDATVSANTAFQAAFASNAPPCSGIALGAPVCPLAVSLNTFPAVRSKRRSTINIVWAWSSE